LHSDFYPKTVVSCTVFQHFLLFPNQEWQWWGRGVRGSWKKEATESTSR